MTRYNTSLLGIAMAAIVLGAMVAAAGMAGAKNTVTTGPYPIAGTPGMATFASFVGVVRCLVVTAGATSTNPGTLYWSKDGGTTWTQIVLSGSAVTATQPAVICVNPGPGPFPPGFDVFAVSSTGSLIGLTTADGGTTWTALTLPTTTNTVLPGTGPAAVFLQNGNVEALYVNQRNHVVADTLAATVSESEISSGVVLATPAVTETSLGIVTVVKGTDAIYENYYATGGWDTWTKLNDGAIGAGAALVCGQTNGALGPQALATNVWLFVSGANGRLYALASNDGGLTWFTATAPALAWQPLLGVLTSSVSVSSDATTFPTNIIVAVRGADGLIYVNKIAPTFNVNDAAAAVTGSWSAAISGP